MIKLIVCDLDGTILNNDNSFHKESFEKINEKRQQGVEFMFATGRDFEMVVDFCKEKNVYNHMILNNGTQLRSYDGEFNRYHPMNQESFCQIIDILKVHDYHLSVHTQKGKYIFENKEDYFTQHQELLKQSRQIDDLSLLPSAAFFTREGYLRNTYSVNSPQDLFREGALPLKIDARHMHINEANGIHALLAKVPHLHVSSSYEDNIEITCESYDKGSMLKEVLKEKGLSLHEVAVFGDGLNDLGMLEGFPYSFAPQNACQQAKEKASYSLDVTNEEGAVYKGIEILEELNLL